MANRKKVAAQRQAKAKPSNDRRTRNHAMVLDFVAGKEPSDLAKQYKVPQKEVHSVVRDFADNVMKPIYGEIAVANPDMWANARMPAFNPSLLVTRKGMKVFDLMRQDDQIKAAMTFKKLAAISSGWEVISAEGDDEKSEEVLFVKDQFSKLDGSFGDALLGVMSALDFGHSCSEQIWYELEDGQYKGNVGLKAIKSKKPHYISYILDEFGNLEENGVVQLSYMQGTKKLPTRKFVIFSHQKEFGNIYGTSDLEAAYSKWWIKENAYRWLSMLLERFGIPPIFALYDPSSMNEVQIAQLRKVIERIQAATAGAIPRANSDSLELWTPELAGNTERVFIPALNMLNRDISRALLMPGLLGLSPDAAQGSFARARVEFDVFILMIEHLRKLLEEVINKQVIKPLVDFNYQVEAYPMFRFLPLTDDLRLDMFNTWSGFVSGGLVEPQREDEMHIRKAFKFPEKEEDSGEFKYGPMGQLEMQMDMQAEADAAAAEASGEIDPLTGLPTEQEIDPLTGLPVEQEIDPETGLPLEDASEGDGDRSRFVWEDGDFQFLDEDGNPIEDEDEEVPDSGDDDELEEEPEDEDDLYDEDAELEGDGEPSEEGDEEDKDKKKKRRKSRFVWDEDDIIVE